MPDSPTDLVESDVPADKRSADIGIVCTHGGELKPFVGRLDRRRKYVDQNMTYRGGFLNETIRVAVVEAGNGFARHRSAVQTLIAEHHPAWILAAGFSSALSEDLKAGDLALASEICDAHGNARDVKCPIPESRRVHVGRHLVTDQHPGTVSVKQQLGGEFNAAAVDTTSLAIAQVCADSDTRLLSVRAIIDELQEEIPHEALDMIFHPDSKAVGGLLGGLVRNLKRAPMLNQWRMRSTAAASHLDRFLTTTIVQLGEHLARLR